MGSLTLITSQAFSKQKETKKKVKPHTCDPNEIRMRSNDRSLIIIEH